MGSCRMDSAGTHGEPSCYPRGAMKVLQDAMDRTVGELPQQLLSELLAHKLEAHGVKLSPRQRKSLAKRIMSGEGKYVHEGWKWWDRRHVNVELTAADIERMESKTDEFAKRLPGLIEELTDKVSTRMLAELKRRWPKQSLVERHRQAGFRKRLYDRWKAGLELLNMLLTICLELGADINEDLSGSDDFAKQRHLADVLRRSHARACQIGAEILALLHGGFADGAMARWRTLHEVAVTASFIAEHGEELAERYVLHQAVESKRAADDYQRCQPRLGYEPLHPKELAVIQASFDKVITRFGKNFGKGQYGWAAHHLKKAQPTFAQIEAAAKVDHLRAHYRMASHNVHANPKGVFFKLGLRPETPLLLAGPSDTGLADPGHGAAISLTHVTAVFAMLEPSLDVNVVVRVIADLTKEIGDAFGDASERLDDDEARLRAAEREVG
jgi:uncharacterized protein DUF5677